MIDRKIRNDDRDREREREREEINHGNTRLPFGLCKKYGIPVGKNWTPRDAWNALKGIGVNPKEEYDKLEENSKIELKPKEPQVVDASKKLNEENIKSQNEEFFNNRIEYSKVAVTKKKVDESINAMAEEGRNLTINLVNSAKISIGKGKGCYFLSTEKKVFLSADWVGGEDSNYATGSILTHELWHGIDNCYGNGTQFFGAGQNLSTHYVLENGKTLSEILNEENKTINIQEIENEYENDLNKYIADHKEEADQIKARLLEETKRYSEAKNRYLKAKSGFAMDISVKKEYEEVIENYNKVLGDYDRMFYHPKELMRKYGDISDMINAKTYGKNHICGMGHNKHYWDNYGSREREFFAEVSSAKITNPESYNLIKKYYPKSVQAYEEIYSKLLSGEIKQKGYRED